MKYLALFICCCFAYQANAQRVVAASDLQTALDAGIARYRAQSGENPSIIYGSSGKLATQILAGAPFDIFFSADADNIVRVRAKYPKAEVANVGIGRLALIAQRGSSVCNALQSKPLLALSNLQTKLAIANPDHAPYGARAKEVLEKNQLWQTLQAQRKIVLAENVATALSWVVSGAAEAGLVAWLPAKALPIEKFCFYEIPAAQFSPLPMQRILLQTDVASQKLWRWLASEQGLAMFRELNLQHD